MTLLLALALLLAWLFRSCPGLGPGLGLGTGKDDPGTHDKPPATTSGDARTAPPGDAGAEKARACMLELTSDGLFVDGKDAPIAEAVRICRMAGKAHLQVTGGARVGTYEELKAALEEAGVTLDERQWPGSR